MNILWICTCILLCTIVCDAVKLRGPGSIELKKLVKEQRREEDAMEKLRLHNSVLSLEVLTAQAKAHNRAKKKNDQTRNGQNGNEKDEESENSSGKDIDDESNNDEKHEPKRHDENLTPEERKKEEEQKEFQEGLEKIAKVLSSLHLDQLHLR